MNKVLRTATITLFALGSVLAAPLLGSKNSFYESTFCKFYLCDLTSKQLLTSTLEEFRYTTKNEKPTEPDAIPTPGKTVWVLRENGVIVSGGIEFGVQDTMFGYSQDGFVTRFIESLADVRVSEQQLAQLESRASRAKGEVRIPIGSPSKKLFLSMVISVGEYRNAARLAIRVSL